VEPHTLSFVGALGPSILDSDSVGKILDLSLDILLNEKGKSFGMGDGRDLQGSGQLREGLEPSIEGRISG